MSDDTTTTDEEIPAITLVEIPEAPEGQVLCPQCRAAGKGEVRTTVQHVAQHAANAQKAGISTMTDQPIVRGGPDKSRRIPPVRCVYCGTDPKRGETPHATAQEAIDCGAMFGKHFQTWMGEHLASEQAAGNHPLILVKVPGANDIGRPGKKYRFETYSPARGGTVTLRISGSMEGSSPLVVDDFPIKEVRLVNS